MSFFVNTILFKNLKTSKCSKTTKIEITNEVSKVYLVLICVNCMNLIVFKYQSKIKNFAIQNCFFLFSFEQSGFCILKWEDI